MFIGLQEGIPVRLGTTGTIILSTISLILGALYAWQLYKAKNYEVLKKNYDALQNALNVSETERKIHEDASKRKSAELADANQRIGELSAKTDLKPVLEMLTQTSVMLNETITLTRESVELSRKADRENAQANLQLAQLIEHHGENDKQVFGSIDLSLKNTAEMLQGLTEEIRDHRKDAHAMIESVIKAIKRGPHERTRQGD